MEYILLGNPEKKELDTFHLVIAPSYGCNIKCNHCYNGEIKNTVSEERWKGVIDNWAGFVEENGKNGIVHFKGGEPFVYQNLLDLAEYSADKGLYVFFTSNGTLIDNETADKLQGIYQKTKGKVILSLNGSTQEIDELLRPKGVYQKTLNATERLSERNIPFDINYVIHSGNESDVEKAIYLAKERGAVQFNILPLVKRGSAEKNDINMADLSKVLPQVEQAMNNGAQDLLNWSIADMIQKLGSGEYTCDGCTAGFKGFAYVTPDGNVYSCPNTVFEEYRLGTIEQTPEEWFSNSNTEKLTEMHEGRLVCKGALEEYRDNSKDTNALNEVETLIRQKISEVEEIKSEKQPISVCFSRNW